MKVNASHFATNRNQVSSKGYIKAQVQDTRAVFQILKKECDAKNIPSISLSKDNIISVCTGNTLDQITNAVAKGRKFAEVLAAPRTFETSEIERKVYMIFGDFKNSLKPVDLSALEPSKAVEKIMAYLKKTDSIDIPLPEGKEFLKFSKKLEEAQAAAVFKKEGNSGIRGIFDSMSAIYHNLRSRF